MDNGRIGEIAGKVWQQLQKGGETNVKSLNKGANADAALTQMAIGWLAREGKIRFNQKGKTLLVSLTEQEANTCS